MLIKNIIYNYSHTNSGDFMKTFIRKNILNIYLLSFMIISYLSIYKASIYISPILGKLYIKQLIWYFIGFTIMYLISNINIKRIYHLSIIIYIINIILLFGLFFIGNEVNNSKAWYSIFNINIQPSELMKISLILINSYIIYYFYRNKKRKELKLIFLLLIVLIIPSILTFLEPDTGSVICYIIITFSMLYISGINKKLFYYISITLLIVIVILSLIYFIKPNIFGSNFFYRIERLIDWKNKSGMQLNNSLIAIGSSGINGHNYVPLYYPEAGTDFIFTTWASSYGLNAALILIILLLLFDLYIINDLKKIKNLQDKYTLFGILLLFFYQQIESISMSLGILPITGITLPFISYGGSSLISYMIMIGIILNIENKNYKV